MNSDRFIVVVNGLLINKEGKLLLGKKQEKPHVKGIGGLWHLPGGSLEGNETPEETLVREYKEETNLKVKPKEIVAISHSQGSEEDPWVVFVWYQASVISGDEKPGDDLTELKWVERDRFENYLEDKVLKHIPEKVKDNLKGLE